MHRAISRSAWLAMLTVPAIAQAQTAPPPASPEQRQRILGELQELRSTKQDLQKQLGDFDARIAALEAQLGVAPPASPPEQTAVQAAPAAQPVETAQADAGQKDRGPHYEPGKGFVLVSGDNGELRTGVFAYARYLNQTALNTSYTDAIGRAHQLSDIRNDLQLQKVSWSFRGWLLDPKFKYWFFFWTSNTSQGEGAQVVIGGQLQYDFSKALSVRAGIISLPTTRSTNDTFPNWLRNDNRIMADEFFRGSYTSAIDASGEIARGLHYRVAIGNNLSQLGVSAQELDAKFNTMSGALWWMPTTAEFGPGANFGDFENHQDLATLVGAHFTYSREDAQGQPSVDDFENSQIRLSDGTLLFSPDPFGTGGKIENATYKMLALNAGLKYKGWYLEGEYYFRWVDDFRTIGTVPVDSLYDTGFSLQASGMIVPRVLQAYVTGSKIFGQYGDPWEAAAGLNIYPFKRKETHFNLQALRISHSPVGGASLPTVVGADGWIFSADWILAF